MRNLFETVTIKVVEGQSLALKVVRKRDLERSTIMENDCIGESLTQQIF